MKLFLLPRLPQLRELIARRIVILDGAMGTMIQQFKFSEADYRVVVRRPPRGT